MLRIQRCMQLLPTGIIEALLTAPLATKIAVEIGTGTKLTSPNSLPRRCRSSKTEEYFQAQRS
jgi:hypothetical protein